MIRNRTEIQTVSNRPWYRITV